MYGTVMRAKATAGNRQAVVTMMGEGLDAAGFRGTYVLLPDDDEDAVVAAVIFDDRDSYSANAHDPATEAWYGRFRALLEDDPEWSDGEWDSFLPTTR
jgi:heme-degrading monooxygenase HmoA